MDVDLLSTTVASWPFQGYKKAYTLALDRFCIKALIISDFFVMQDQKSCARNPHLRHAVGRNE
jgi:hypothetical protein